MPKYDIFISYRRVTGAQYARILQLMLQQRGYKVFLDYDELKDGKFGPRIKEAIHEAPIFILVLSKDALVRCKNEDDWVREEIQSAISLGKKIIPVDPDKTHNGIPDNIPDDIRTEVGDQQNSDIDFGQTLGVTVDFMIKERIAPIIGKRTGSGTVDKDYDTAKETLKRIDARNRFVKRVTTLGVVIVVIIVSTLAYVLWSSYQDKEKLSDTKTALEQKYQKFSLVFSPNASISQMIAVDKILQHMTDVTPDSLWMSQFECSIADFHDIIGGDYDKKQAAMPITNISYGEFQMTYLDSLRNLTNVKFDLPSAEEWQYAAKGGYKPDGTLYSGSDQADNVAWYNANANNKVHPSDGQQGKEPNNIDLYDMSGNVGELCNTPLFSNGTTQWTVCGGDITSSAKGITVTSQTPIDANAKSPTTGFRLIIRK